MDDRDEHLLAVVQASKLQSSLKITVPKKIAGELGLDHGCFVGFYRDGEGIKIKKME